ncbi:MAG: S-layer homology domain-containing protein [Dialister micraerophilus]|uniref:S-layer homology domain-containing protein n=1 Tax=Dialister micraerophilus TaxID=309120 RepID=UPI00254DB8A8|nr:S-layer homology domain-containing protein [Dialister micraerophilus]MDK8253168.1 S-layer homology domain-containing protein [Dialister micraerophilus]
MNKVFKIIWNKSKSCFSVVSEIAKNHKKTKAVSKKTLVLFVSAFLVGSMGIAHAEDPAASLTAEQKAVYDAVVKAMENNTVHYVSVKGESQDNDSNYKNDGAKGKGAVAIGEKALAAKGGTVSIGRNAHILGNGGNTDGEGSVAIGDNSLITTNGLDLASIAIGKNAKVLNGSGKQERGLSFTPDNFDKPGLFGRGNTLPKNADKVPGGIAIGTNSYARTGSIQLGHHTFAGYKMGGIDVTNANEEANIVGMTTVGTNTYNKGALANMYGAYSIITGDFTGAGGTNSWTYGPQNFGANVVGSLNSIRSKGHIGSSGVANSIVGVANTVENANGTLVYGAGNKITNSIKAISADAGFTTLKSWDDTVTGLQKVIKNSNSGGAVLAIGGGNVADYVRHSQLVGVNNTVTGTENKVSEYNMVDGYKNTVTNGTHVTMIGSENTATDSESTLVMGDKQKVTKVKHGVLLGSQDAEKETTVSDIVAVGHNAYVKKEGGIALGSYSIASIDKGIIGYDPLTGKASTETSAIWKATQAALSVGSTEDKNNLITRQITGVAAGTEDTDAVNVAQLKALEKKLSKGGSNVEVVGDKNTGIVVEKDPKENTSTPSTGGTTPSTGGTTPAPAAESKTVYKVKLDKKVDVGNISIDGNENNETITIGKGDNNVIVNNTGLTIKDGPSVTKKGINAGNKKITNVADATEDSDAVNYKQLKQAMQGMTEVSGEINHAGAHSAALAALHPLDFDPDEKLDIAVGVGNYNGSNAVALGAYYRPNESTMISVGGSFGSGKNMVNAGLSVKVGQGNNVSRSRIATAKEIKDMRAELETLRKAVAGISQGEKVDPKKMKLFPDVPENHWAYEYVKELAKQGVIDGYPDGTFKGDRMMTRYEFAAMLYKAMQKGINVNKKILDEFEVELERFRIDVIAKDKDGNPTIERIRVN